MARVRSRRSQVQQQQQWRRRCRLRLRRQQRRRRRRSDLCTALEECGGLLRELELTDSASNINRATEAAAEAAVSRLYPSFQAVPAHLRVALIDHAAMGDAAALGRLGLSEEAIAAVATRGARLRELVEERREAAHRGAELMVHGGVLGGNGAGDYAADEDMDDVMQRLYGKPAAHADAVAALPRISLAEACSTDQAASCIICLGAFAEVGAADDVKVAIMPCGDAFHEACLLSWLERSNDCPLCRHALAPARLARPATGLRTPRFGRSAAQRREALQDVMDRFEASASRFRSLRSAALSELAALRRNHAAHDDAARGGAGVSAAFAALIAATLSDLADPAEQARLRQAWRAAFFVGPRREVNEERDVDKHPEGGQRHDRWTERVLRIARARAQRAAAARALRDRWTRLARARAQWAAAARAPLLGARSRRRATPL